MREFQSARDLLDWACEDIVNFDAGAQAFFGLKPYVAIREVDAKVGYDVIKVCFDPVPSELRKLASHAIWDLKHSLDHAIWAAITLIRGRPAGNVHFLWADHRNGMWGRLRAIPKGETEGKYPPELWPFFEELEPYPSGDGYSGGSDELVEFSKMANSTKHAVALAAGPRSQVVSFSTQSPFIRAYLDKWDSSKNELTIGEVPREAKVDMKLDVGTKITFSEVELFKDHDAGFVMSSLARAVESIIDSLECEVCDILAHQGRS